MEPIDIGSQIILGLRKHEFVALLFSGEPGVGKTRAANVIAELVAFELEMNYKVHFVACNEDFSERDVFLTPSIGKIVGGIAGKIEDNDYYDMFIPSMIVQAMYRSATVEDEIQFVIIDEFDKTKKPVDTYFLSLLQEGIITNPEVLDFVNRKYNLSLDVLQANHERLVYLITSNEQRDLNEALFRRCKHIQMEFPSRTKMVNIVSNMINDSHIYSVLTNIAIEFGITMMYQQRSLDGVSHKMVQNELVGLFQVIYYMKLQKTSAEEATAVIRQLLGVNEQDRMLLINSYKSLKYIVSMLYSK